jgi:hypothetical protein
VHVVTAERGRGPPRLDHAWSLAPVGDLERDADVETGLIEWFR